MRKHKNLNKTKPFKAFHPIVKGFFIDNCKSAIILNIISNPKDKKYRGPIGLYLYY